MSPVNDTLAIASDYRKAAADCELRAWAATDTSLSRKLFAAADTYRTLATGARLMHSAACSEPAPDSLQIEVTWEGM